MADGQYTSFPIDYEVVNVAGMQQDIASLQTEVAGKQNELTAGTGISIVNDVISATGGGGGGGGADPYDSNPEALGTASPGVSDRYSRGDHVHPKPTYTKSDVGLGNVANVLQYSANNPPPYPVTSVNGSTGAVTLSIPSTASDVGAIAAPSSPATGAFLVWNGSAWVAQTLATWQGGNY